MSRYIDADALIESVCHTADLGGWIGDTLRQIKRLAVRYINSEPTIKTKQIKYFDEEEKVWKIGEVIVDQAEGSSERVNVHCITF